MNMTRKKLYLQAITIIFLFTFPNNILFAEIVSFKVNSIKPSTPLNIQSDEFNSITLQFSDIVSYTSTNNNVLYDEILIINPLNESISIQNIDLIKEDTFRVEFPIQTQRGTYIVKVGPQIMDNNGNFMDQDEDQIAGEIIDDKYISYVQVMDADIIITTSESISSNITIYEGKHLSVIGSTLTVEGDHKFESLQLIDSHFYAQQNGSKTQINTNRFISDQSAFYLSSISLLK